MQRPLVVRPVPGLRFFATTLALSTFAFTFGLLLVDPLGRPTVPAPIGTHEAAPAVMESAPDVAHDIRFADHVERALEWLARHQFTDGSWGARTFSQLCERQYCPGAAVEDHYVGVTAMATIAYLESGLMDSPGRDWRARVRTSLRWLARRSEGGRFGGAGGKYMYEHALATLAFIRAYERMADEDDRVYLHFARLGISYLMRAKNPGGVWRYDLGTGRNDTSVTGWVGEVFLAARRAGIATDERGVPFDFPGADRDIVAWLGRVTDTDGTVGYSRRGVTQSAVAGCNDHYAPNETLTALSLVLRMSAGDAASSDPVVDGVRRICTDKPFWGRDATTVDFNYWYHGTLAMDLCRHEHPEAWGDWSTAASRRLVSHQRSWQHGCLDGSWDPVDKWGRFGGRVYSTALNTMTLVRVWRAQPPVEPAPTDE